MYKICINEMLNQITELVNIFVLSQKKNDYEIWKLVNSHFTLFFLNQYCNQSEFIYGMKMIAGVGVVVRHSIP